MHGYDSYIQLIFQFVFLLIDKFTVKVCSCVKMEVESNTEKGRRISLEQRALMLDFMNTHPSLATGRFTAPDGAKHKQRLLNELATVLNSVPNGITKSPDKWLKDWRSDTKAKAALLKREMNKTGGGKVNIKARPLSPLEEQLLSLLGPSVVYGHEAVLDPISTESAAVGSRQVSEVLASVSNNAEAMLYTIPLYSPIALPLPLASPATSELSEALPTDESVQSSPIMFESENLYQRGAQSSQTDAAKDLAQKRGRRKRQDISQSQEGAYADTTQLIKLSEDQVEISKKTLKISESKLDLMREGLELQNRQTAAIESAAGAFIGAMQAVEQYYKKLSSDLP